jgi:GNAT superfamily N-acetyltransferase
MIVESSIAIRPESGIVIRRVKSLEEPGLVAALADVLIDCVEGGASVSFMHPLERDKAEAFWRGLAGGITCGERILLVAENGSGEILGTVQVVLRQPDNQPHRADVSKLLVHRKARKHGVGAALMRAAEQAGFSAGKTTLVLDTATGSDAERLYPRLGWQKCGQIPDYALWPRGGLCDTTLFCKRAGR